MHETVYVGSSTMSLATAVSAGLGVMALPRSRTGIRGLMVWEDAPLPKLPDIFCGIYLRDAATGWRASSSPTPSPRRCSRNRPQSGQPRGIAGQAVERPAGAR